MTDKVPKFHLPQIAISRKTGPTVIPIFRNYGRVVRGLSCAPIQTVLSPVGMAARSVQIGEFP
jgi:hypothetical protein